MATERGQVFAFLQDVGGVEFLEMRDSFRIKYNGRKHHLDRPPDGGTYSPKAVRYLVSQLHLPLDKAKLHFPTLF